MIQSQKKSLNISTFIKEAQGYTQDILPGVDLNDLLNSAMTGKVDNEKMLKGIGSLLGKEVLGAIKVIRKYYDCHYYS